MVGNSDRTFLGIDLTIAILLSIDLTVIIASDNRSFKLKYLLTLMNVLSFATVVMLYVQYCLV
ncbi:MAG: hypothetical protein P4M11_15335 [Candidatus Pacebacteria bacterium]|nr:hypothetical protein [Candidatus Paceibacterota bacterium]